MLSGVQLEAISRNNFHEESVDSPIYREFGMEGCRQHATLADQHWRAFAARKRLNFRADREDPRGPDENHLQFASREPGWSG